MKPLALLVDDDPVNARLVRALLEHEGYEVECAAHANAARRAVERRPPSLVLMDLPLPDADGYVLTREFRQRETLRDVPIIAVAPAAMRGAKQLALEAGCSACLARPIDTRRFFETVSRVPEIRPAPRSGESTGATLRR